MKEQLLVCNDLINMINSLSKSNMTDYIFVIKTKFFKDVTLTMTNNRRNLSSEILGSLVHIYNADFPERNDFIYTLPQQVDDTNITEIRIDYSYLPSNEIYIEDEQNKISKFSENVSIKTIPEEQLQFLYNKNIISGIYMLNNITRIKDTGISISTFNINGDYSQITDELRQILNQLKIMVENNDS